MASLRIKIAITPGAEDGVGPELLAQAIASQKNRADFFWCGDFLSLRRASINAALPVSLKADGKAILGGQMLEYCKEPFGESLLERQAQFLEKSMALAEDGLIDAIVTGPIDKKALAHLASQKYAGQTEYFSKLAVVKKPFMAFLGGPFMLSLLTTHIPLNAVANALNQKMIEDHLDATAQFSAHILRKKKSTITIAVLGLNPHAGEDGLIGDEENAVIIPAIKNATKNGLNVAGPLPADGFFAYWYKPFMPVPDVVVALYHDQGLIPYKLLAQGKAVNVTFGLTIPRVSPAHGTASMLTGTKQACIKSTKNAIDWAVKLARLRAERHSDSF